MCRPTVRNPQAPSPDAPQHYGSYRSTNSRRVQVLRTGNPYLNPRTLLVPEGTHGELPSGTVTFQRYRSRGCEHNSCPATQVLQLREHATERGREPKPGSLLGPVARNSVQSYRFDREHAQGLHRVPVGNASDGRKWDRGHNASALVVAVDAISLTQPSIQMACQAACNCRPRAAGRNPDDVDATKAGTALKHSRHTGRTANCDGQPMRFVAPTKKRHGRQGREGGPIVCSKRPVR